MNRFRILMVMIISVVLFVSCAKEAVKEEPVQEEKQQVEKN